MNCEPSFVGSSVRTIGVTPSGTGPHGGPYLAWLWLFLVAFGMYGVSAARADEITTRTDHFRKIKIVDYAYGQIRFRQPSGDLTGVSILDVHALLVDTVGGVSDLNQAEIYVDKGRPAQAGRRYQPARRATTRIWKERNWKHFFQNLLTYR